MEGYPVFDDDPGRDKYGILRICERILKEELMPILLYYLVCRNLLKEV